MYATKTAATRRTPAERAALRLAPDYTAPYDVLADLSGDSLAAWHDFRRTWARSGKSAVTLTGYGLILAMLGRWAGGDILAITPRQAAAFLADAATRVSPTSVNSYHRSLRAWFGWACKPERSGGGELLDSNPFAGIGMVKCQQEVRRVLADDQLRALLATTARRQKNYAEFERVRDIAILGIWNEAGSPRVAEMAGIEIDDVDLALDTLLIHGKGGKDRVLVLSASTAQAVSRYLRARSAFARTRRISAEDAGRLWLGKRGAFGVPGLTAMLRNRAAAAGIGHVHPHILRHTAYSRFEERGGLPNDAMELFGWSSDTMTKIYGRSARARRAMDKARRLSLADL